MMLRSEQKSIDDLLVVIFGSKLSGDIIGGNVVSAC